MSSIPPLVTLGRRILIMGPSNAGKSTLALAISRKTGLPAVHLDQLHHRPNTDWQPRPRHEFEQLQRAAIAEPEWVMDGNYSGLLPERLARATGAIVLDENNWLRFLRYSYRTLVQKNRIGALEGNKDSLKWSMIHWVLIASRHNGRVYRERISGTPLPHVFCRSRRDLQRLYTEWALPGLTIRQLLPPEAPNQAGEGFRRRPARHRGPK